MRRQHIARGLLIAAMVFAAPREAQSHSPALEAQLGPAALQARQSHGAVEVLKQGEGAARVYIFLPARPALRPPVPVVFLHHGWQGMDPLNFGALIDHLAREGQIVIYPVYQQSAATSPQKVVGNAVTADRAAVAMLAARHLKIDPRHVLYFGYSMGAAISLDIAIAPGHFGLPAPRALVLAAPGDAPAVATGPAGKSIIGDLGQLPRDLPVVVITGAQDSSIGLPTARRIFAEMCQVAPDRRVLMVLPGDSHGSVVVHAQHGSPGAPDPRYDFPLADEAFPKLIPGQPEFAPSGSLNQLDFFGYWKVVDAIVRSLPIGRPPGIVFGHGNAAQLYLGSWPDGTLFAPIRLENPCP